MALQFLNVTVRAVTPNNRSDETDFLVSEMPESINDLMLYTKFRDFLQKLPKGTKIAFTVKTFVYGDKTIDGVYTATIEEIAYLSERMKLNKSFLAERCTCIGTTSFEFVA